MAQKTKPSIDYETYAARLNLQRSAEPRWHSDVSYFWASIIKMQRRAIRRKALKLKVITNGKTSSS